MFKYYLLQITAFVIFLGLVLRKYIAYRTSTKKRLRFLPRGYAKDEGGDSQCL
ncbi:hypothetical protein ANAPRD1_01109 [Anaplasma phagocytophilum]|nr:hypothetical protein ANAPRD1_01109 [Anaplasma phagocytophilum]